ncbi:MAG: extracellular solute-binding protein [Planctomycetes bacterium]|nr:extracellular solute-binding protein [Planctomycetota bacterium]
MIRRQHTVNHSGMKNLAGVAVLLLLAWLGGCGRPPEAIHLRLYTGAGLRDAVEALTAAFQQETGVAVDADYAGSGVLISRAKGDPQADLFMPGDVWYVERLAEVTDNVAERVQVSYFVPTIIVAKGNPKKVSSLQDFARPDLKVALGNPQACQIGRLCVKIFAKAGLDSAAWKTKESLTVNELGLWVQMRDVDAAIVWDAIAEGIRDSVDTIEIPAAVNEISTVVCARLKSAPHPKEAQRFLQFLVSPTGQRLLKENGYRTERPYP